MGRITIPLSSKTLSSKFDSGVLKGGLVGEGCRVGLVRGLVPVGSGSVGPVWVAGQGGWAWSGWQEVLHQQDLVLCGESRSIIPSDTSLTCFIVLRTFVKCSICSQSSSLSTGHVRKHDDITHASAWLMCR